MRAATLFLSVLSAALLVTECRSLAAVDINHYIRVERKSFSKCSTVSVYPKGWMVKAVKTMRRDVQYVKEVVFVPNLCPPLLAADASTRCLDDEHFVSHLVEQGFCVHTVQDLQPTSKLSNDFVVSLREILKWRTIDNKTPARSIAIVAQELSCPRLLSYLSEQALPMGPSRKDIGAIVLLDPPPLLLLSTLGGEAVLESHFTKYLVSATNSRSKVVNLVQTRLCGNLLSTSSTSVSPLAQKADVDRIIDSFERRLSQQSPQVYQLLKGLQDGITHLYDEQPPPKQAVDGSDVAAQTSTTPTSSDDHDEEDWRKELQMHEAERMPDPFARQWQQRERFHEIMYSIKPSSSPTATPSRGANAGGAGGAGAGAGAGNGSGIPVTSAVDRLTAAGLVGTSPSLQQAREVGQALLHRILIINTFKSDVEESEEWSLRNCEEVSKIYDAGAVLSFDNDYDAEDPDSNVDENVAVAVAGEEGEGGGGGGGVWNGAARRKHELVGTAVADWLGLLTAFAYL